MPVDFDTDRIEKIDFIMFFARVENNPMIYCILFSMSDAMPNPFFCLF